ncbi:MAG: NADH-quinone oxidoreductase subunit C [Planctomycetes bacterium]|nr:NADH-quinone oxidoreductase subunit C [Planctomycetota bacterium]
MIETKNADVVLPALETAFSNIEFSPAPLLASKDKSNEQVCVRVPAARLLAVMQFLRRDPSCQFEQLCDLTCVDYLNFPNATDRYGVIYSLLSISHEHRLWVKCFVNDPSPEVPSVTSVWQGAVWLEREVWDLFGIKFTGHPDLRRIMTWETFKAHPLRKDYPVTGRGEREDFERIVRESA